MINREIIRNKVVQLTYAYYQNGSKNIDSAEKELLFSLSKAYDLYAYMLALIPAVARESRKYLEVAQGKAQREGTDMPSQKFAYNRFAIQVEQNLAFWRQRRFRGRTILNSSTNFISRLWILRSTRTIWTAARTPLIPTGKYGANSTAPLSRTMRTLTQSSKKKAFIGTTTRR